MRFFSIIAYAASGACLYMALLMAWGGNFNFLYIYDLSAVIGLIAGITLSLINFRFSEIFRAIKDSLSGSPKSYEILNLDRNVLQTAWKYLFSVSVILVFAVMVIILSNLGDTTKLGPSLAIMSIIPLYTLILKFFIFMPLEISLEKKIILAKQQKIPGQVV